MSQVMESKFINFHVKNLMARNPDTGAYSTGILMATESGGSADTAFNLFENCSVVGASIGVSLNGEADTDCCHNVFIGLTIRSNGSNSGDVGLWLVGCDNNTFYRTWIQMDFGSGYGVVIDNPVNAYCNYFYHLQAGLGLQVNSTGSSPSIGGKNIIFGYDRVNGEPAPTTDSSNPATDYLAWTEMLGDMYGWTVH